MRTATLRALLQIPEEGCSQQGKQGDYYAPGQTTPQQASPGQEQKIQQGDFYKPNK